MLSDEFTTLSQSLHRLVSIYFDERISSYLLVAHNTVNIGKFCALFDDKAMLDLQYYFTENESFFQGSKAIERLDYRSENGVFSRYDSIIKGFQ